MVRVLAIDTSSQHGSVALVTSAASAFAAEVIAYAGSRVSNAHGESLLPLIESVLRSASLKLVDVDLIAVGIGPGSFTGTRIGVATAKGLSMGAAKPLRGISSFDSLAIDSGARAGEEIAVAIDARHGEVSLSVLEIHEDDVRTVVLPTHANPTEAWARLGRRLPDLVIGDGVRLVPELAELGRPSIGAHAPRAIAIGALACARQLRMPLDECEALEPLYVRPPDITLPKGAVPQKMQPL
ncbi:MAG: tRNA (adenosine(37)-N6)-threonylcarbamoyltransferase complex dimerization subunit type 1 TsaB [Polyangiales bacterium]